jgi:hypothetical protein
MKRLTSLVADNKQILSYLVALVITLSPVLIQAQTMDVKLVNSEENRKVDILVNDTLFTSFRYPVNIEKPFLYPVFAPNGSVITRGFPLEAREGERVDHPHQLGIWFNHGNVNGLDFWNNSSAIPADQKDSYGQIIVNKITRIESGKKGILEVISVWNDNKGNTLLVENTSYIFSGNKNSRTIDHISVLTAIDQPVVISDNKEGLFAIRVDRAFEMPTNESSVFTDSRGNPTTVKSVDNKGVTGMFTSSNGLKGDNVWGTRNKWVVLSGIKENVIVSFGIFDHPKNPGFPAYAHARGYGLFSVNNLGQNSYDPKMEKVVYNLEKGQSMTLRHRFYVESGSEIRSDDADKIAEEFARLY